MGFDRKTGELWAGDVGQNVFEEIIVLKAGGNYGWSLRESLHPFGERGVDVRDDLIEPIWEYHHDLGRSITGGVVYRGARVPELNGAYLYADFVSMRIWALWYDATKGRVIANREINGPSRPVASSEARSKRWRAGHACQRLKLNFPANREINPRLHRPAWDVAGARSDLPAQPWSRVQRGLRQRELVPSCLHPS